MNKVLIIQEANEYDSIASCDNCILWNYSKLRNSFNSSPGEWTNYDSEYFSFKAAEKAQEEGFKLIFVSSEVDTWPLLILHILLNRSDSACHLLTKSKDVGPFLKKDMGLFKNEAIKLFNLDDVESFLKTPGEVERLISVFTRNFVEKDFLDSIFFSNKIDKHQIANEWGAKKLLLNSGYLSTDIAYEWPKTIYFKYLSLKNDDKQLSPEERKQLLIEFGLNATDPLTFTPLLSARKILLIDDNADKGWTTTLAKVFGVPVEAVDVKKSLSEVIHDNNCLINPSDYDIIFLDLRIPERPGLQPSLNCGIMIMDEIKKVFPAVPIVVFTASHRASTLDLILDHGADAMYVKESPLYSNEENYSKDNFRDFVKTVTEVLAEYRILRSYWRCIEKIRRSYLPQINDSKPQLLFKSRVEERLLMFYGLLKKGYEQWNYDRNTFFYSDYELAFITLWSILNELQEAYFEKGLNETRSSFFNGKDSTGKPQYIRKKLDDWRIRDQSPERYFIIEKPVIEEHVDKTGRRYPPNLAKVRTIKYSDIITTELDPFTGRSKFPYYQVNSNGFEVTPIDYKKSISMQIAFLLLNKQSLTTNHQTKYLQYLFELNSTRNSLYLTHGENDNNFYSKKEVDKRLDRNYNILPTKDIQKLFELVAFLLTGDDSITP